MRAVLIFNQFGRNLGEFLLECIPKHDPHVVVVGGNISNASDVFFPEVEKVLSENGIHLPVRKTLLGEHACLIGAASMWLRRTLPS